MKLTRPLVIAAALAVALAGAAFAGAVAHKSAATVTVTVTEKEFHIGLSTRKGTAGRVKFLVKNTGKFPHALAIAGPGVKSKRTALIRPGKSAALLVTLTSGKYALWCPVPGHAAQGMKTTITVPAAAAGGGGYGGGGGTSTTDTSTDSGTPWG